jgi:hypothetical protein
MNVPFLKSNQASHMFLRKGKKMIMCEFFIKKKVCFQLLDIKVTVQNLKLE